MAPLHPPLPSTAAAKYRATMLLRFPLMQDWGCYSCRHIAGSASWSQHAWANAWDLHPPSKAYGDSAAAYIRANAGTLSVSHLLWQVPDHFDHIHADFNPQGIGTPPCAGGVLHWAGGSTLATSAPAKVTPHCRDCANLLQSLGSQAFTDPRFKRGGSCYDCLQHSILENVTGAIGGAGDFLGKLPTYLKIAGGGVVLFGGLAVLLVAATGRQNQAARMVTSRVRVPARARPNPRPAPQARPRPAPQARTAPARPRPRAARPARPSTSGPRYVRIGGQRVEASRLSPKARRQLEG